MSDLIERDALLKDLKSDCPESDVCVAETSCIECIIGRQSAVNRWIPVSKRLPDMRIRVFVVAVRNREHYPKDTEPSRMFIAMRIEMLSDGEWYWAEATDIYGYDGIGGIITSGGWKVVAWMPMPEAYEPQEVHDE